MTHCKDWEERIALAAGGDLSAAGRSAVELHVAGCPGCRGMLEGLRQDLGALHQAYAEPIAEAHLAAVRARVLSRIDARRAWRWWRLAPLAAAALLAGLFWPHAARVPASVPAPRLVPRIAGTGTSPAPRAPVVIHRVHLRRTAHAHRTAPPSQKAYAQPLVVKFLTDDPNVVIYWVADSN